MTKDNFTFLLALLVLLAIATGDISGQTRKNRKTTRNKKITVGAAQQSSQSLVQCRVQDSDNAEMTYEVGSAAGKLSREDKKRIKKDYGALVIPEGETERAKEIRQRALAYKQSKIDEISKSYEIWLKAHPNATPAEIQERLRSQQFILDYYTNDRLKDFKTRKRWDWREQGLNVGPVLYQGDSCNTCWAFAAADAAATSIQIADWKLRFSSVSYGAGQDGSIVFASSWWEYKPVSAPFVQDLLNCLPIPAENICDKGWHGTAFDFMVNKRAHRTRAARRADCL